MPLVTTLANASAAAFRAGDAPVEWVAVQDGGGLRTSSEAIPDADWTIRTSSFGSTNINWVATDGVGTWVAVGDGGKLASSTDGITWTQRTSQFGTGIITCVAYGGGTWVAVGNNGSISTSTNATTWTAVTTTTSTWSTSYDINHVAYGNGNWVGNNLNGTLKQTTAPGGVWTTRTEPFGTGDHYAEYHPAIGSGIWTAGVETGTDSGDLASSTDAQTWTSRTPATSSTADTKIQFASNSSVIIASSNDSTTWVMQKSTNGTSWTAVTEPVSGNIADSAIAVRGSGQDILVAIGIDFGLGIVGMYLYSTTDGSTFTQISSPGLSNCLAHRDGHQSLR